MKITKLTTTVVAVPYERPLRWAFGVSHRSVRTILEIETDVGLVGIGEAVGPAAAGGISAVEELLIGRDPHEWASILHRLGASTRSFWAAATAGVRSAIEMACLDLIGKEAGLSVTQVLGGSVRDRIETCAIVYFRHDEDRSGGISLEMTPRGVADRVGQLIDDQGFTSIKLHGGVLSPEQELETLRLIQEHSPGCKMRLDPNGAWSVETSVKSAGIIVSEGLNVEYLEDPTQFLEGMAQVRQRISLPLATNMCVVEHAHLAPAIRMGSVDIVLADIGYWGGFRGNQQMVGVCDAFRLGVGLHAHGELGIARAAMVHLAQTTASMAYAIDDHGIDLSGDIVVQAPRTQDGIVSLGELPGLGVELDREAMERYHREWANSDGIFEEFADERQPGWIPATPLF